MPKLDLKPRTVKFIFSLPPKHKQQIKNYILNLGQNPLPSDSKKLIGYDPYLRADAGEYRIIYRYDQLADLVTIILIGKRNGDEVYKQIKRILK